MNYGREKGKAVRFGRKITDSDWFGRVTVKVLAILIRAAYRLSRWDRIGFEDMDEALQSGEPVIVALWHQRLMMSPYLFNTSLGKICTLTSANRDGKRAGQVQKQFGFETIAMSRSKRHIVLSREVLGKMKEGYSIGIATDGSRGPARIASTVPLVWARASGARVFVVAFSANRVKEFNTWDRLWLPLPFTKGVLMCREWQETVPRRASDEETEKLRLKLESALDAVTDEADLAVGRQPQVKKQTDIV